MASVRPHKIKITFIIHNIIGEKSHTKTHSLIAIHNNMIQNSLFFFCLCLGKVRIKVFAQIKYKLKQRIWFWNTLVQLFIFHSPMHQAALTLWSSFNSGFETLVLLKHVSFNNFESDRVVFFIYCFDYLLSNFSFPICSFKLEESIKDVNIRLLQRKRKVMIPSVRKYIF